jgi:hypothetical protein
VRKHTTYGGTLCSDLQLHGWTFAVYLHRFAGAGLFFQVALLHQLQVDR